MRLSWPGTIQTTWHAEAPGDEGDDRSSPGTLSDLADEPMRSFEALRLVFLGVHLNGTYLPHYLHIYINAYIYVRTYRIHMICLHVLLNVTYHGFVYRVSSRCCTSPMPATRLTAHIVLYVWPELLPTGCESWDPCPYMIGQAPASANYLSYYISQRTAIV